MSHPLLWESMRRRLLLLAATPFLSPTALPASKALDIHSSRRPAASSIERDWNTSGAGETRTCPLRQLAFSSARLACRASSTSPSRAR